MQWAPDPTFTWISWHICIDCWKFFLVRFQAGLCPWKLSELIEKPGVLPVDQAFHYSCSWLRCRCKSPPLFKMKSVKSSWCHSRWSVIPLWNITFIPNAQQGFVVDRQCGGQGRYSSILWKASWGHLPIHSGAHIRLHTYIHTDTIELGKCPKVETN